MLMVLMTMAIIIVVGTSMLFVTLSSFSNSIADTQQERAYNAALTVSDTLKGSTQLNTIIETYFTKIKENGFAEVQFYNDDTDFDNQAVNYTIVNGVKVYVTLSKSPNSSKNTIDKVLVDVTGVKGSQESTVSFEAKSQPAGDSTTIQDTFGNSFVVSNNMGSEKTSPYQIFKRIEGDVSINCFETENGERVMKTRLFNPLVLEGVTGSIYANGDLIIGAVDNMIRVQGNVYVDGNLTIRGLELGGVNLPGLMKKYYNKKYIHYWTYSKTIIGSVVLPFTKPTIVERNASDAILGEAMYEKLSDGSYRPIQVYDKISHFTLMDMAGDANEYTFWTKNWENGGAAEQVTITLRVEDQNGIWQDIDAEYNQGGINNAQYLGASMYYDQECSKPIVQFPEGGNIYCSGDIIFDTVNYGYVYTYDAGGINTGATDGEVDDDNTQSETPKPGVIENWLESLKGDVINTKYDYYSLSYEGGRIPVQTYIGGNVYCQGRMIIAPDSNTSYVNYKNVEKLGISTYFSNPDIYVGSKVVKNDKFVLKDSGAFLSQIKDKWEEMLGKDKEWGDAFDFGTVKLDVTYGRFDTNELVANPDTLKEKQNFSMESFIEAYKKAYNESGNTLSVQRLKNRFEYLKYQLNDKGNLVDDQGNEFVIDVNGNLVCDGKTYKIRSESESDLRIVEIGNEQNEKGNAIINYSFILGDKYMDFGGKYYDPKSQTDKDAKNIAGFNTPKFNETSNLYIQNSPIRKGTSCGDIEHKNSNGVDPCTLEKYASDDKYRVVQNVDEKDTTRTVVNSYYLDVQNAVTTQKVIGSISYTAALSVRYCTITVNNVFCDGIISVLESKIPGFENAAAVNVNNNYLCSDSVKNELKKASIKDFLCSLNLSDDEILKEYFGVDKNNNDNNAFKGETNFVFDVRDDSQDKYDETWVGWAIPVEITHNRKVFVLRAHYEMTETVKWKNDQIIQYHKGGWQKHGWYEVGEEKWTHETKYSGGKYVADLMYCFEDNTTYTEHYYENKKYNATNKLITSNGDIIDYDDRDKLGLSDAEEALVKYLYESKDSGIYKYALNLTQTAFIDFRTTPIDENGKTYDSFEKYFKEEHVAGFNSAPNDPRDGISNNYINEDEIEKKELSNYCAYYVHDEKYTYDKSAERVRTARYDFTLKPFANITGGSELDGYDKLSYVLGGADILASAFLNTKYFIAMFSNGTNDFNGIINGLVGSAIKDGEEVRFGEGDISDQFDAMKRVTSAFKDNSLYGMYLVIDKKYSNVNKDAYVSAIFDEIKSSKFAAVVEANMDQDESKENLEKKLQDLIDNNNIVEYNAFDVYGRDDGKPVTDYMAINPETGENEQLRKKVISLTQDENTAKSSDSWMKVGTLPNENQTGNVVSYWYLRTGSVEDDPGLRLMRFYNKENSGVVPLVADSTFGVDEKYERNRNELSLSDGGFVAGRTAVYFTIKRNTYFNFADSREKEIVFAADENGADQNTRMNVLIDTSDDDVFIFFRCADDAKFVFKKCTFQVIGDNDAYLILMDNTSFDASAFELEISNSLNSKDKSDEKVGTHFKSGTYQRYDIKFKRDGQYVQATDLYDAVNVLAMPVESSQNGGYMFIVGMGRNNIKFGRGGTVNAMIYIPHGRYSNESSGILNIVPIASSGNNEASIVAKDIYISGSNRGQLIFSSYDAAKIGSQNNNSSGLVMDSLINPDNVTHDTKWVAGNYYYG